MFTEGSLHEIALERQIPPLPPVVLGGVLVVPAGLLAQMTGTPLPMAAQTADTINAQNVVKMLSRLPVPLSTAKAKTA